MWTISLKNFLIIVIRLKLVFGDLWELALSGYMFFIEVRFHYRKIFNILPFQTITL